MSQFSTPPLETSASAQGHRSQDTSLGLEAFHGTFSAKAPGKAILVGEHAVIYGAKAIAFPVKSVGMHIHLTPLKTSSRGGSEQPIQIKASLGGRALSDHLKSVILEAFHTLGINPFSLEIEGTSSGLIGAGMGSSATLCVVILRALAASVGRSYTPGEISRYANLLERHFHGNPSGLDTAVVAYESPLSFRIHSAPELIVPAPLAQSEDHTWPFVLLDSTTRSSTIAMVKGVSPYFLSPHEGERRVQRFDRLATLAQKALLEGDGDGVASLMNEAGILLREAGASSPVLDEIIDLSMGLGCLGAKPTGAGGGGCVLVLLDPRTQNRQLNLLRQKLGSARVIPLEGSLGGHPGVQAAGKPSTASSSPSQSSALGTRLPPFNPELRG